MKIKLIAIGKTDEAFLEEGIQKYLKRLKHYHQVEFTIIPDIKQGGKFTADKLKEEEGKLILQKVQEGDHLILLDEKGKNFTSSEFAGFLQKKLNAVTTNLVFVIGGAFGFSPAVYERANDKISLSKMTFSHQMVRLFFTEQLYRGFTILRGEKYHHD
ncbi:23S rRNA (pseudouridine(1915)-N(3))-methyltransferase RlmH [Pontibacter cellulosilyticus]|uniref:Ribosomal RNA large subunit methyltransferase H n=1 Tax=Pontibacter cellulosilyticus TaxID=1720253 RepID=A0A923SK05_9BACT|nr:23S rRNA (pseudouridine(1915)-N(3))-methyltransferase RlmH [Pontibacter cellulosilyticus]MBC5993296.1 23S rRNA (pseudouridine(1915)-N(3))-methyltransferase RlmH [Pontibacter cellulosilyticus]